MIKELGRKMDEHRETFNKELGDIKKNQGELRNTITEIKNTPEYGIDSRLEDIEERISELELPSVKVTILKCQSFCVLA